MAGDLKWYGPQFEKAARAHLRRNISAAAIALVNFAKQLISIDGTGQAIKAHVRKSRFGPAKKYKKRQLIYNFAPSEAGEPPRVQTGRLRGSVAWELIGLAARAGTNVRYGRWLELGTKKMAARPWLRRSFDVMKNAMVRMIQKPMS